MKIYGDVTSWKPAQESDGRSQALEAVGKSGLRGKRFGSSCHEGIFERCGPDLDDEVPACWEHLGTFLWQKTSCLQVNEGSEAAQSDRLWVEKSLVDEGGTPQKYLKVILSNY